MPSRRITHHHRPSCPARTLSSSNNPSTFVVLATTVEHKCLKFPVTLFLVAYNELSRKFFLQASLQFQNLDGTTR
uniref:Uncharacterized protein n=1 Tax=Cucumis melo TaxID=3656 RepID=A0A9I9EHK0_CUCME